MKKIYATLLVLFPLGLFAQTPAGVVKSLKGEAKIHSHNGSLASMKIGDKIYEKDTIKTSKGALVGVVFEDNTLVSIGSQSEFSIDEYLFEPSKKNTKFKTNLKKGSIACMTGLIAKMNPDAMKIEAKSASMGIRGTYFIVDIEE